MRFKKFSNWLETTKHHFLWNQDINSTDARDSLGIPILARPGFRPREKKYIEEQSKTTENWLNSITKKYGINWLIIYLEPNEQEDNTPEGFEQYKQRSIEISKNKFKDLIDNWKSTHPDEKPPNIGNTIVYVKSTSRLHQLGSHQQVHNIAHGIWGYAKIHRNKFILRLRNIIYSLRKKMMYNFEKLDFNDFNKIKESKLYKEKYEPSEQDIIIIISRLLNLKSMSRIHSMSPNDFQNPKKTINQVYGNWEEFIYEMMAAFFRKGGYLQIRPQEILKNKMEPSSGVQGHPTIKPPSNWVWDTLPEDNSYWEDISEQLTLIIVESLYECTYKKAGRPIYANYGELPLE